MAYRLFSSIMQSGDLQNDISINDALSWMEACSFDLFQ